MELEEIVVPSISCEDEVVWDRSSNGNMTMKQAYESYRRKAPTFDWCKHIWQVYIPPRVSMFVWRILHNRLATDDNISKRGIPVTSVCLQCSSFGCVEDLDHLFIHCDAAANVWTWASQVIHHDLTRFRSAREMLRWVVSLNLQKQNNLVILTLVCYAMWTVWKSRNMTRFENVTIPTQRVISTIKKSVSRVSFLMKGSASNNVDEAMMLNFFNVSPRYKTVTKYKEIFWSTPPAGWYKVNTDGAANGNPGVAACGGIFRMFRGFVTGSFAMPLGIQNAIYAEIMGFMKAIELALLKGWFPLWVETDSAILVAKVESHSMDIPWKLKNRWMNTLEILKGREFRISHIFREGNAAADAIAKEGIHLVDFTWWYGMPKKAQPYYERNLFRLPEYRIM